MSFASEFHLDGEMLVKTLQPGIEQSSQSLIVCFKIAVENEVITTWALDQNAAIALAYARSAQEHAVSIDGEQRIQVTVGGFIMRSQNGQSSLFATHFTWHTSKRIREAGDVLFARLKGGQAQWPYLNPICAPVEACSSAVRA